MKRELKEMQENWRHLASKRVSRLIPMKRELKGHRSGYLPRDHNRFKTDPDEKGTERIHDLLSDDPTVQVSRLIPMKRELKVCIVSPTGYGSCSVSRLIPMKRELKVKNQVLIEGREDRVSRLIPMKRELKALPTPRRLARRSVSRLIPMKRELKD